MSEKPSISPSEIRDMIVDFCDQNEIEIPDGFEGDFEENLGDLEPLEALSHIRHRLCPLVNQIFREDQGLEAKYKPLKRDVQMLRFDMAFILGFAEYINTEREPLKKTDCEILMAFFESLPEGKKWIQRDIKNFKINGIPVGKKLFDRINHMIGFNLEVVKIMLGDDADKVLKRNPPKEPDRIRNILNVRRYLTEFLEYFAANNPPGTPWRYTDVKNWNAQDGLRGEELHRWIRDHAPGNHLLQKNITAFIAHILASQAEYWLSQYPFQLRETGALNIQIVTHYLKEFLADLHEDEPWFLNSLGRWRAKDGTSGKVVAQWLTRNIRHGDEIDRWFIWQHLVSKHYRRDRKRPFYYRAEEDQMILRKDPLKYQLNELYADEKINDYSSAIQREGQSIFVVVSRDNQERLENSRFRPARKGPLQIGEQIECRIKSCSQQSRNSKKTKHIKLVSQENIQAEPIPLYRGDDIASLNIHTALTIAERREKWLQELSSDDQNKDRAA